ncbi:hypothetical protein BDV06DRAFT_215985 [Aspergillus oleicola]
MRALAALAALAYALCTFTSTLIPQTSASPPSNETTIFDYIILGGGTAGLTLANKLSSNPSLKIAIIEPGHDESTNPNVTSVEGFGGSNALNTHVDWVYRTTAQRFAGGRKLEYHSGRAWGGTSCINGMTFIRPATAQLDAWEILGNKGWTWNALWPYHLSSESFTPPDSAQIAAGASYNPSYHGYTGPVHVAYQYGLHNGSFVSLVNETWKNLGVDFNKDVNGGDLRGFFVWPQTLDREENVRWDANRAYYAPVKDRGNVVLVEGTVGRIVWDDYDEDNGDEESEGRVVAGGVEYIAPDGHLRILYAKREVILAAGSVRSPGILELSGVGNPDILNALGIKTKVPLPTVGENALDQPNTFLSYNVSSTFNETFTGMVPYVTYLMASDIFGDETENVAEEVLSQLESWAESASSATSGAVSADSIAHLYQVQHELMFNEEKAVPIAEILTTGIGRNVGSALFLLLPFSRGSVHIPSSETGVYPAINPNYFLLDWDLHLQRRIAQIVKGFWETGPVKDIVGGRVTPSAEDLPDDASDEAWEGWIRNSFTPNHHLLGTTAMLPRDLGGVVDANLVVYGTKNVRVVDTSGFPTQVSGHLTSLAYAVAERAADLILEGV